MAEAAQEFTATCSNHGIDEFYGIGNAPHHGKHNACHHPQHLRQQWEWAILTVFDFIFSLQLPIRERMIGKSMEDVEVSGKGVGKLLEDRWENQRVIWPIG
jgi:hypothetical protein